MGKRITVLMYGVVSYATFFATFLYAIGFVGNLFVPRTIDGEATLPLGQALLIDLGLLALFAVQHSVMARPAFKRAWTKVIPEATERSTYTLLSSVALILLFWLWQPLGGGIWEVRNTVGQAILYGGFFAGWLLILVTTFLINHFDLFGLRQVWLYFRGREYTELKFVQPWIYKVIRHPLYVGWFMAFWFTPSMTVTHLLFAVGTTLYILVAIQFEERDLVNAHGEDYVNYRRRVPMLIPRMFGAKKTAVTESAVHPSTN